jgi:hypothetical protein
MFAAPRRRRAPRLLGIAAGVVLVPSLLVAGPLDRWGTTAPVPPPVSEQASAAAGADEGAHVADDQPATAAFAVVDAVTLHLPAPTVVLVGFHEASSPESLAFDPRGVLQDHQNTTKFDTPEDDPAGPDYVVLSSRGRPFPATSAIDVLMRADEPVRAPTSGTVTEVRGYHLYGTHPDQRIELAPDDAPEQRIVMIHLEDVQVGVGDRVAAGETTLARSARTFPFGSHIDRYTEPDRHPHVHYEIKRATGGDASAGGVAVDG